ncbi:MAG: prepilin-type N-terminal cleavage/methylation domain-containing protein [Elusimicrobium sp.]|jgi:prepilin-type N-terminal cleavage/methylation domain-containing protein|nr:prepilin-type N-terminal cleavage/methylation domain-containing protein [Elusimicrobium sp.]
MPAEKKGFTLVEVLVALFLSGLVIAGLVGLWVSTTNFASSSRQELLWKNQLSVGERKIHKDVIEAVKVDASVYACETPGSTNFLTIYKNYTPDLDGCLIPSAPASVVFYCALKDQSDPPRFTLYREEGIIKCDQNIQYKCICSPKSDLILQNVNNIPQVTKLVGMANSFGIKFAGYLEVGKNKRPIMLDYDKTFNSIGGGQ